MDQLSDIKLHMLLRGFTQQPNVDYDETFSPIVKPAAIHSVLSVAHSHDWSIQQLDVENAFLHGHLKECLHEATTKYRILSHDKVGLL